MNGLAPGGKEENGSFEGEGGVEICWRRWPVAGTARASVVISHGGGEHSGRYGHVASRLNQGGFSVFALDHRGHGRSGGERVRFDSVAPLAADLGRMVDLAAREDPEGRPFLLAHSMGSPIALLYAFDNQDRLRGMVFTGALALLDAPLPVRIISRVLARISPATGVFAVDPDTVSRDPGVVRAYDADPLNFHGKFPAGTMKALGDSIESLPARLPSLRVPLLVMHGAEDRLTSPGGSELIHRLAGSDDKQLRIWEGLRHEILNEPEHDAVMDEIVAWLEAHIQ